MTPEQKQLLDLLAQGMTGVPGVGALPVLQSQLGQVSPGSSLLLGYKALWNASWNHIHETPFPTHTQPPMWQEY